MVRSSFGSIFDLVYNHQLLLYTDLLHSFTHSRNFNFRLTVKQIHTRRKRTLVISRPKTNINIDKCYLFWWYQSYFQSYLLQPYPNLPVHFSLLMPLPSFFPQTTHNMKIIFTHSHHIYIKVVYNLQLWLLLFFAQKLDLVFLDFLKI